ncbi:hypothetical protein TrLO_g10906 [Triparma laevis f. longispina]|uniref:Large ribosomal subunit protein bL12 C-terminal domain-containing protein n=1 Tax=Triparma laevis f. longispina TaxID=1714387 RepID=A0A9W7E1F9_9STRA|nr:hypothetical protein TrLO_g10906 [Triparma laevis f. longispina]
MFSALTRAPLVRSVAKGLTQRSFQSSVKQQYAILEKQAQGLSQRSIALATDNHFNFLSSKTHSLPVAYNQSIRFFSEDAGKRPDSNPSAPSDAIPPPLAESPTNPGKTEYSDKVVALCDQMLELNILELTSLTSLFQEKTGITDDMLAVSSGGGGGGGPAVAVEEEVKEEKVIFDVKLTGFDAKSKIKVIKEVRTITGLGLKEAKEMVEGAPKTIKKDVKKEEADELVEKLKAAGGEAELE